MCSGPRSWLLTIHPNLAVSILVSSGHQCLGFFRRQVSGIWGEALQDESGEKSRGGSHVEVTLQEQCPDGGRAPVQRQRATGRGSRQQACSNCAAPGCLGCGCALTGGCAGKDRPSSAKGGTSLQAGHLHLLFFSANPTNAKVSSLCWGIAGNGGPQRRKPPKKMRRRWSAQRETTQGDGYTDGDREGCSEDASIPPGMRGKTREASWRR